jgi:hypothetical protein
MVSLSLLSSVRPDNSPYFREHTLGKLPEHPTLTGQVSVFCKRLTAWQTVDKAVDKADKSVPQELHNVEVPRRVRFVLPVPLNFCSQNAQRTYLVTLSRHDHNAMLIEPKTTVGGLKKSTNQVRHPSTVR